MNGLSDLYTAFGAEEFYSTSTLEDGLLKLLSEAASLFPGSLGEGLRTGAAIAAVAALCAVAASVSDDRTDRYVRLAGVLSIAVLTIVGMNSLLAAGRETVAQMNTYNKALLPTLATAGAAAGKPASSIFRQAATVFTADLLLQLYDRLLYPLLYIYAALATFNAALPHDMVKRLAGLVKWAFGGLLTATLLLFTSYLTIGGAISGSADAVSVKAARTALGGFIPLVGNIISDASETLLLGASVVKNAVGVVGLLAVLGIALGPCLALAVRYLCVKLAAALAGTLGGEGIGQYADDLAGLYAMMLGLVSASAFLFIISIVSTIIAGT
jgi:stage III sporulation protein AE